MCDKHVFCKVQICIGSTGCLSGMCLHSAYPFYPGHFTTTVHLSLSLTLLLQSYTPTFLTSVITTSIHFSSWRQFFYFPPFSSSSTPRMSILQQLTDVSKRPDSWAVTKAVTAGLPKIFCICLYIMRRNRTNYAFGAIIIKSEGNAEHPIKYVYDSLRFKYYAPTEQEALAVAWVLD